MQNSKAKLSPEEVFNNKKNFSNKIHARVLRVNEEISKSLDNLKILNAADRRLFLNAVNQYYRDLCAVIFHLRQVVIKTDDVDQGVRDLQNVITELNKIVLVVQDVLNLETANLIPQLKNTITDVGCQVEMLMKIIEFDNLHEHKQMVLDCQHDLVISAEALKLFSQMTYLNPMEMEGLIHEQIEKIKNNLIIIKTDHELLEEDFSHYTRHYAQNLQNTVNYVRKMATIERFQNDLEKIFKNAETFAIDSSAEILEAVRFDSPMNKMLDIIENTHNKVSKGCEKLQEDLKTAVSNNIGEEDSEKGKHLLFYMFINTINGLSALNQSIEDAIMKK